MYEWIRIIPSFIDDVWTEKFTSGMGIEINNWSHLFAMWQRTKDEIIDCSWSCRCRAMSFRGFGMSCTSQKSYCKRRSDIKSQHTKSISLSLLQWKQPMVTYMYNTGEPCSHNEKCSVYHKLCTYRGILIIHMYFFTNVCPIFGLHCMAQIKLRYEKPMFTQDSWCVFWKRFIFLTAVYDFLWDSRTTNVFS